MPVVEEDSKPLVMDLPVEPHMMISDLRDHVDRVLHDLGEDHRYDVQLVITELVSDVLDHATGYGRLRVFRGRTPCQIFVEVDDESTLRPRQGQSRLGEHRGRGLVIVGKVAAEWGTRFPPSGGKTVHALIHCADEVSA